MNLYQVIDIWKRVSEKELIRYRCFKNLQTNKYSVQSADYYRFPLNSVQVANLEKQFVELFVEQAPDERTESYESIAEAIAAHIRDFKT